MEFIPRFFKVPKQSFFLFGPRGTGKSAWAKRFFKDCLRLDLLEPDIFRAYASRPEQLKELVEANPQKRHILIDEVQRIPSLLSVVHNLIEEHPDLQFILTGSSSRKLKRTGVDLLAGRALLKTLHPFMAAELGSQFKLEWALKYGLLPLVWASKDPSSVLKTYQGLYLREEVQMEALVRHIGQFGRFLEAMSFSHAGVLNLSNISRECEVQRKTVEGYVEILEDLLLAYRIPVFDKRAKREMSAHPKFYFFDAGVYRALRPQGPLDHAEAMEGAALEGLVVEHLRAWNAYRGAENNLYFWRTRAGVEVDVVLYGKDGLWGIEVKNTQRVRPEDLRALRSFKEDYPDAKLLFLYRGKDRLKKGEITCLPCEEFLKGLDPNHLF